MKLPDIRYPFILSVFASLAFSSAALADRHDEFQAPFIWPFGVQLEVEDIRTPSSDPARLVVLYPSNIDLGTLDDEDLWVVSRSGFNQMATFHEAIVSDAASPWEPIRAIYHVAPPADGWTEAANERYTVLLEPETVEFAGLVSLENRETDEIILWPNAGAFVPPQRLGSFEVAIGELAPSFPLETAVAINNENGETRARVELTFPDASHEVTEWGELTREGNRFFINVEAEQTFVEAIPPALVTYGETYRLGALEDGQYTLTITSRGRLLASERFMAGDAETPEIAGNVAVFRDETGAWVAQAHLYPGRHPLARNFEEDRFLGDRRFRVVVSDWGEVQFDEASQTFSVNVSAEVAPVNNEIGTDPAGELDGWEGDAAVHRYVLGSLDHGEYEFTLSANGAIVAEKDWEVAGRGPEIALEAETIHEAPQDPYTFQLIFEDGDGLDLGSIEAAPVTVYVRNSEEPITADFNGFEDLPDGAPAERAAAVYTLAAPGGEWGAEDNGFYAVAIDAESVLDLLGNPARRERLGGFRVLILPNPVEGEIEIAIDFERHDEGGYAANLQLSALEPFFARFPDRAERRGNTFAIEVGLTAAGEIDPNEPVTQPVTVINERFRLGRLTPGQYWFTVSLNNGQVAREQLVVEGEPGDGGNGDAPGERIRDWLDSIEFPEDAPPEWRDELGDPDNDFLANLLEYALGMDPRSRDRETPVSLGLVDGERGRHLALNFTRGTETPGVEYIVEVSNDLGEWRSGGEDLVWEIFPNLDGSEDVRVCLPNPVGESEFNYMRLRVVGH